MPHGHSPFFLIQIPPSLLSLQVFSQAIDLYTTMRVIHIHSLLLFQENFYLLSILSYTFRNLELVMEYREILVSFNIIPTTIPTFERSRFFQLVNFHPVSSLMPSKCAFVLLRSTFEQPM